MNKLLKIKLEIDKYRNDDFFENIDVIKLIKEANLIGIKIDSDKNKYITESILRICKEEIKIINEYIKEEEKNIDFVNKKFDFFGIMSYGVGDLSKKEVVEISKKSIKDDLENINKLKEIINFITNV